MARDGLYRHLSEVQIEDEPRWRQREQRQQLMADGWGYPELNGRSVLCSSVRAGRF